MNPPLPASCFIGLWKVQRRLIDHLNRTSLQFNGQAHIETGSIIETGNLCGKQGLLEAKRVYLLAMDDTGVDIRFFDGRDFIRLGLLADQRVIHQCSDDLYDGRFMFRNPDFWAEIWRVSGPRKRYVSLTRYERILA
ncbi:DUF6314 family protein [Aquamicrobium segne]|uniref:DUF6314 family protein n=1 Tax=Aquamicrobium segne TaxID=469547 RepID=A0ABW0GWD5_9HYPH